MGRRWRPDKREERGRRDEDERGAGGDAVEMLRTADNCVDRNTRIVVVAAGNDCIAGARTVLPGH
jgi:hypothetical protein